MSEQKPQMIRIRFFYEKKEHYTPQSLGNYGYTYHPYQVEVEVELSPEFPEGEATLLGEAICHPKDNFCKEVGRKLALARAIKGLPRASRMLVWDAYFKRAEKGA